MRSLTSQVARQVHATAPDLAVELELALGSAADDAHALAGAVKLQDVQNLILPFLHLPALTLPHKHCGVGALVEEETKHLASSYQGSFIW